VHHDKSDQTPNVLVKSPYHVALWGTREKLSLLTETKVAPLSCKELTQLMIDHDLGVTTQRTYAVKRIDSDFFGEE
jgi:hypothetical protein